MVKKVKISTVFGYFLIHSLIWPIILLIIQLLFLRFNSQSYLPLLFTQLALIPSLFPSTSLSPYSSTSLDLATFTPFTPFTSSTSDFPFFEKSILLNVLQPSIGNFICPFLCPNFYQILFSLHSTNTLQPPTFHFI
ncbi:hypothetical protein AYI68_g186 [Smittium mucronatum]|uniref:Uncharacterized protein n=1 Tax=Smittium mucronatum TaxID=133383 RepID=A0A1R0H924_9FUNG|nr:hypothetical protein AYI68_g186 [Smittium mucronatum]